jgi:hypothetical protein
LFCGEGLAILPVQAVHCDPPISASQVVGTPGVQNHLQLFVSFCSLGPA